MDGFDIIESKRCSVVPEEADAPEVPEHWAPSAGSGMDRLAGAVADNFDRIVDLASSIISYNAMKEQNDHAIKQMQETRALLLAEAEAYAKKKDADTKSVVERMKLIRDMMNDYYHHSNQSMTGEDFCKIMTGIVETMGKLENG